MDALPNLSNLTSVAFHTLSKGSNTERFILGAALVGTALFIARKIYNLVARFFTTPQTSVSSRVTVTPEVEADIEKRIRAQYPLPKIVQPVEIVPIPPSPEVRPQSSLIKLRIHNEPLLKEKELAIALHAYHDLKTDVDNSGGEGCFVFLTSLFLNGQLPGKLTWEAKKIKLSIPFHYNKAFADLNGKLEQVGLSLKNVSRSEIPFATAEFEGQPSVADPTKKEKEEADANPAENVKSTKEIFDLNELYESLQGTHILLVHEIDLQHKERTDAKTQLQTSRLNIIEKSLSTVRAVFIDNLVETFPEKHKDLYSLFDNNSTTLRFVLDNLCWHVLDQVLESIEITFIPSKKQESMLAAQLASFVKDPDKLNQAQSELVLVLADLQNKEALAKLKRLIRETRIPEGEAFIKELPDSELQSEEELLQKDLNRWEGVQKFYDLVSIAVTVADAGKGEVLKNREVIQREKITREAISKESEEVVVLNGTYAHLINESSRVIVRACEEAFNTVAIQRCKDAESTLDHDLEKITALPSEIRQQIIDQGWTGFKDIQALSLITGQQRWLITKKMIIEKLAKEALLKKGGELVSGVGKGVAYFFKTIYGRLVTALLAFHSRTIDAEKDPKPADRIARGFIDSLVQCHTALQKAKKVKHDTHSIEDLVVKELEKNGEMHPSASNKQSADVVFLGKLIIELLSVLQPEGLAADIRKMLTTALLQPGESEPTLIQKVIDAYNEKIRPTVGRSIKPLSIFLFQALENIIEKRSTTNFASQLSNLLSPESVNAYIVEFLNTKTEVPITQRGEYEERKPDKWYREDGINCLTFLNKRVELDATIKRIELYLESVKQATQLSATPQVYPRATIANSNLVQQEIPPVSIDVIARDLVTTPRASPRTSIANSNLEPEGKPLDPVEVITGDLIKKKKELALLDKELVPLLLRRMVIASMPSGLAQMMTGYLVEVVEEFSQLIQDPRILRHIIFNILEKTIHELAIPLEENPEKPPLNEGVTPSKNQSVFDYLFSDNFKREFGMKIFGLFSSLTLQNSVWGWITDQAIQAVGPGEFLFNKMQGMIEGEIIKKYQGDSQVINCSVLTLIRKMDNKIHAFAEDKTEKGMTQRIAAQLGNIIGVKDRH